MASGPSNGKAVAAPEADLDYEIEDRPALSVDVLRCVMTILALIMFIANIILIGVQKGVPATGWQVFFVLLNFWSFCNNLVDLIHVRRYHEKGQYWVTRPAVRITMDLLSVFAFAIMIVGSGMTMWYSRWAKHTTLTAAFVFAGSVIMLCFHLITAVSYCHEHDRQDRHFRASPKGRRQEIMHGRRKDWEREEYWKRVRGGPISA